VGSPAQAGWTGKLLGSLIASQFSAPNIAGATPPPKDPSQQDQDSGQGSSVTAARHGERVWRA